MKTKRVAVAIIRDENDNVLFGIRNDNGLYTNPGGHLHHGEDPYEGVLRELKEETGLTGHDAKLVRVGFKEKKKMLVYIFDVKVDKNQEIDPSNDPDKEASVWVYMDPNDIVDQLHVEINENWGLEYWCNN